MELDLQHPGEQSSLGKGVGKLGGEETSYEQADRDWKGLRKVPRAVWEEMLKVVKCQVLSVIEGEEVDAYLLR